MWKTQDFGYAWKTSTFEKKQGMNVVGGMIVNHQ